MSRKPEQHTERPPIRGEIDENPTYRNPTEMNGAGGNPLIEALPAPWDWDAKDSPILDKLTTYFHIDREALKASPSIRRLFQLAEFKAQYFQVFKRHRDLEQSLSFAIRLGYLGRNPMDPRHRRKLHDHLEQFDPSSAKPSAGPAPQFIAGLARAGQNDFHRTNSPALSPSDFSQEGRLHRHPGGLALLDLPP